MTFPAYPEYKDSGVEWLGEVPAHWDLARSDAYISSEAESISADRLNGKEVFHYSIPVVQETGDGQFEDGNEIESSKLVVSRKQVLFSKLNPRKGTVCLAYPRSILTVCSGEFVALFSRKISHEYLLYLVRTTNFRFRIESMVESATRSHQRAAPSDIAKFRWAFPPKEEQATIAAFLDHETARIDVLVAEQQRLIALLKEKRQAVISHAVTKGLDPDVPMKDSGVEWLGEVPAHWEVCRITHHLSSIVDYRGRTPEKDTSGVFLVTAKNIKNGRVDYEASEEYITEEAYREVVKRGRPKVGDVVFTTEAPLGQVANLDRDDIALAQRVIKFRGVEDKVYNQFLKFWIMGDFCQAELESLATGSTALGIKGSKINQLSFCMPPFHEQQAIIAWVSDECLRIDELIKSAYTSMTLLEERRSALISAAVTGKIDVRGWTPPADSAPAHQDARMEAV